ncbi:uncharacterized protein LOC128951350, partial [Oppia nitens]|uniref:uncharacterized protein LOC128951350 n=1 Tax=Oppia nitens TaxID=1686743 RepID=UPI0023DB501A
MASGYSVAFVMNDHWKGYFTKYGIEEILFPNSELKVEGGLVEDLANRLVDDGVNCATTALENCINLTRKTLPAFIDRTIQLDKLLDKLLPTIQKDVILIDYPFCLPSVVNSGTPWVGICSCNPLYYLEDEKTPPPNSGLPAVGYENEWKEFRLVIHELKIEIWKEFKQYLETKNIYDFNEIIPYHSKYLNIYGFPEELDYTDLRPMPDNWHQFDNLMRSDKHFTFEIPDKLKGKPGKLVYFSLGSMGAANVENMNRLLAILSKSNNRFIISMGPQYESIKLYDNMWGQSSVPQIQVLPLVDLAIIHGGNNTTTETFYFGKPMIVMPLFGDQWDNAQRVEEKGFGVRLDAYKCTEKELLSVIDTLLNDNKLTYKLKQISQRIQQENSLSKLPKLIEK